MGQKIATLKSILYNLCSYCGRSVCVVSSIPGDVSTQCEICSVWPCDLYKITGIRGQEAAFDSNFSHIVYGNVCLVNSPRIGLFLCKKLRIKYQVLISGLLPYFSNNIPHCQKLQKQGYTRRDEDRDKSKAGDYTKKTNIMVNKR